MRQPNFNNLLKVLERKVPDRPTLFEFFMNGPLYEKLTGKPYPKTENTVEEALYLADAFASAGYDYVTMHGSEFNFPKPKKKSLDTISLNDGAGMTSWEAFKAYDWPDPESCDYSKLKDVEGKLPEGMKILVDGPGGVLENVIGLVGYDNLCLMIYDDPELAQSIFDAVGQRLVRYYEIAAAYDTVGVLISNDDWGFKQQTFLSTEQMRQYVYPWHKKIVEAIHRTGKPALLHSCGNFNIAMDDVVNLMKFDGKHSYEDAILPVEDSYERWHDQIAILGGIDLDFVIRSSTEDIQKRCKAMLERVKDRGGYALGTGNSVPEYVPQDHYFAMIDCVR
jgi:uroporphyrinogen decarboxylase